MIRRPPRSTPLYSSAASDVYKRQVGFGQVQHGHVIVTVRIESCRDQQQLGLKSFQRRQPMLCDGCTKFASPGSGWKRHVDDMLVAAICANVRIERVLKSGTQHDTRFAVKNGFGTVAVMNIEIRYRH